MPRPRRSADQWQNLIQQHAHSSLSIAEFCRKKNLSTSSFHRWRRVLRYKPGQAGFLEVNPPPAAENPQTTWLLEMDLPGGGHLRLRFEP